MPLLSSSSTLSLLLSSSLSLWSLMSMSMSMSMSSVPVPVPVPMPVPMPVSTKACLVNRSTLYILLLVLIYMEEYVDAKVYMRCELARKLLNELNFERSLLSNWICCVEHESGRDTSKIMQNANGSKNYGLFQINSRYCQEGRRGGICNIKCEDLIDENIADDAICAKRIRETEGFQYWSGWQRFCRNPQNLPNLKVICGI